MAEENAAKISEGSQGSQSSGSPQTSGSPQAYRDSETSQSPAVPGASKGSGMPETSEHICPVCGQKSLELSEAERDIPFFGKVFLFSMTCPSCKFHKSDIECAEQKEPCRHTFEIASEEDLKVRVVKSAEATVKIPYITDITPGDASQGYVTNIEGILQRVKREIEAVRDTAEDDEDRKKAKNLLKKLIDIMWGKQKQKIIIEDPTGNSAIISDKAVVEKMKVKPESLKD